MGSAVIDALSESGGEEGEYESDSDGTSTLALRRRAASDDEEDEGGSQRRDPVGGGEGVHHQDAASSVDEEGSRVPYSDDEEADDIEGAPPLYEEDEEEEELLEEEDQEQQRDGLSRQLLRRRRKGSDEEEEEEEDEVARGNEGEEGSVGGTKQGKSPARVESGTGPATTDSKEGNEEEKKEAEPFVVPTAGAFYMHDDRFRDNGGARPRRSMAGRKLWEAKDDKLWVHDLFEELNLQNEKTSEGFHKGGRRGGGRGRGRGRGRDRGGRTHNHDDGGGARSQPVGRGRVSKNEVSDSAAGASTYAPKTSQDTALTNATDADVAGQSSKQPDNAVTKKLTSGSYLNSASPPFIPSGALRQKLSTKAELSDETGVTLVAGRGQTKGREQYISGSAGSATKARVGTEKTVGAKPQGGQGRGSVPHSTAYSSWNQGDTVLTPSVYQQVPKGASTGPGQQQHADAKAQRNQDMNRPVGGPVVAQQSVRGVALQDQATAFLRSPQNQGQPQQAQGQPSVSRSSPRPSSSNHVQAPSNTRYKSSGSGRGARMGNMAVGGRGSYVFTGGSIGAAGTGLQVGDPGFQPTPAVGTVSVPYGAQAPAGIGVPAVGLPIPNYPYAFPNSEVTWVPVLAGGGAIGGAYGAPYIALEGAPSHMYYTQPSAQPVPYHLPGREMNGAKPPGGLWKPPPSPELGTDEFEQRQSKPRRYSEMNFGVKDVENLQTGAALVSRIWKIFKQEILEKYGMSSPSPIQNISRLDSYLQRSCELTTYHVNTHSPLIRVLLSHNMAFVARIRSGLFRLQFVETFVPLLQHSLVVAWKKTKQRNPFFMTASGLRMYSPIVKSYPSLVAIKVNDTKSDKYVHSTKAVK